MSRRSAARTKRPSSSSANSTELKIPMSCVGSSVESASLLASTNEMACSRVSCDSMLMYMYDDSRGSASASIFADKRMLAQTGSPFLAPLAPHSYPPSYPISAGLTEATFCDTRRIISAPAPPASLLLSPPLLFPLSTGPMPSQKVSSSSTELPRGPYANCMYAGCDLSHCSSNDVAGDTNDAEDAGDESGVAPFLRGAPPSSVALAHISAFASPSTDASCFGVLLWRGGRVSSPSTPPPAPAALTRTPHARSVPFRH
mmetsp:Transcript_32418/g.81603  ORF Transcript_32418/g.81603 Transcript_32418/m.81603 type:complete len:258 (+) Transcript_32418:1364-2137(+)